MSVSVATQGHLADSRGTPKPPMPGFCLECTRVECYVKLAEKRPPAQLQDGDDRPPLRGAGRRHDFVLAEWTDAGESSAERPIAPLHLHRSDDEAWYVLDGTLGLLRGDERLEAPAGSASSCRAVSCTPSGTPAGEARY